MKGMAHEIASSWDLHSLMLFFSLLRAEDVIGMPVSDVKHDYCRGNGRMRKWECCQGHNLAGGY